ncbi:hypothetical protein B0H14DRAFT_2596804 [Mycena olivaceomarginata]|nr:hypothetical protein B0H14DRAFT_2596804 [Mycena olivaceomarginata]
MTRHLSLCNKRLVLWNTQGGKIHGKVKMDREREEGGRGRGGEKGRGEGDEGRQWELAKADTSLAHLKFQAVQTTRGLGLDWFDHMLKFKSEHVIWDEQSRPPTFRHDEPSKYAPMAPIPVVVGEKSAEGKGGTKGQVDGEDTAKVHSCTTSTFEEGSVISFVLLPMIKSHGEPGSSQQQYVRATTKLYVTTRPSSRVVSPELSYSQVVNPAPLGGSSLVARTPGSSAEHSLPPLNREVDFDAPDSDVNAGHPWTPVSRKTVRSHRERSTSPTNGLLNSQKNASGVTSTVELAIREMSEAELIAMARRFEALAHDARAAARQRSVLSDNRVPDQENLPSPKTLIDLDTEISVVPEIKPQVDDIPVSPVIPSGEGTSRLKGKGADPHNWGNLDFAKEISDTELQAQKDALENLRKSSVSE